MANRSEQLPAGWIKEYDWRSNKYFYVNKKTKRRQWNDPRDDVHHFQKDNIGEPRSLPTGWYIGYDARNKRNYYFNPYLNVSQWEFPSESATAPELGKKISSILKNLKLTPKRNNGANGTNGAAPFRQNTENSDQIKMEINRRKKSTEQLN